MKWQPLDRAVLLVSLILTVALLGLLGQGNKAVPRVREFLWHNSQVSAIDRMFIMTFSRPMNQASVERNLKIVPTLPGKFSWAGRRMAYTLTAPISYGQKYNLTLTNAHDRITEPRAYLEFNSEFYSPDRGFVYIGTKGEELGRLVLHNFTQNYHRILTPAEQIVTDFRIYPDRGHILYGATPKNNQVSLLDQELFRVTTGIGNDLGQVEPILDNKDYQIFKFDLSPDGQRIVVQRLSRSVQGSYGLWQIKEQELTPLSQPPGGKFMIAPDNTSLAITQGQGVAILALEEGSEPLDFLPRFGNILSFNQDGSQAAVVKFNPDFTRSLYLVNNQGEEQELAIIQGSLLQSEFDFSSNLLYTLLTRAEQTATTYLEHPYLAVIDLQLRKLSKLLDLEGQVNVTISLAPDNKGILLSSPQSPIYLYTIGDSDPLSALDWWGKKPTWLP